MKGPENTTCQLLPISSKQKGEDGMGKAGKGRDMVEDKSSERVLCEKVVREIFEKVCVSCVEVAEDRSCESCVGESCVCVSTPVSKVFTFLFCRVKRNLSL